MSQITRIATYLPCWGDSKARGVNDDEDAVTMAVSAGLGALGDGAADVGHVVLVTRDLPLNEGGNSAALLAGLGLSSHLRVSEVVGGAPALLDAVAEASDGTLVIGVDVVGAAGAGAALTGAGGARLDRLDRVARSMPVATRDAVGRRTDYADPRLLRVRGVAASLAQLAAHGPIVAVAGLTRRDAAAIAEGTPPALPTSGASSALFALAALAESGLQGALAAVEQATISLAELGAGDIAVTRDERAARPLPKGTAAPGNDLPIALAAYDRAFEPKVGLRAARCTTCATLSYPPRHRCLECGSEDATELADLPRDAVIYSLTTVRVPVPGLISPYTLTIVELGDTEVRVLVRLTGAEAGSVAIGDRGRLVLRLVAVRSGVPDYGYGFLPDEGSQAKGAAA